MITSDKTSYRGLNPDAPLVLAEGGKRYSLKVKRRTNVEGKVVDYWVLLTRPKKLLLFGAKMLG